MSRLKDLICAYKKYDPATSSKVEIFLLYPGVRAWILHQMAHYLYKKKIAFFPRLISEISRFWTGIEIPPGAVIGDRVIMDHGTGIVIGETAIVENDVMMNQVAALGGTSLERVKRHPTIKAHCVLGSGAKILGNIVIGEGCRVGANSVVVKDAPAGATLVGIPAKVVSSGGGVVEGKELEHGQLPDPIMQRILELEKKVAELGRPNMKVS